MKFNYKYAALLFIVLAILMVTTKTTWWVCTVCGMQKYDRSIMNKRIDLLSQDDYDEFKTHEKWMKTHGKSHTPHIWKEVKNNHRDLLKD